MCHAISIAWSPPGPAKYRRCLLGVLTANYILSLWESEADPSQELGWKRCMIINNELKKHNLNEDPTGEDDENNPETIKLQRRKNRINSFGWSHTYRLDAQDRWGIHLIAISNDCNDIIISRITSAYDSLATGQVNLTLEVLARINIELEMNGSTDPFAKVNTARRKITHVRRTIRSLAWSPWIQNTSHRRNSLLACAVQGEVYIAKIHVSIVEDSSVYSSSAPRISVDIGGDIFAVRVPQQRSVAQLKWHDKV